MHVFSQYIHIWFLGFLFSFFIFICKLTYFIIDYFLTLLSTSNFTSLSDIFINLESKNFEEDWRHVYCYQCTVRGRSQTTFTRFGFFLTTYPCVDIFYGINLDKKWIFLDHLPTSSCKRSLWTAPNPFVYMLPNQFNFKFMLKKFYSPLIQ